MNKRALRKFTPDVRKFNLKNGIFCAEQVKYVVCTAVHNIGGRRTLVLYVYLREKALSGDFTPLWTVFQTKDEYLTLCRDQKGMRWLTSMFDSLGGECNVSGWSAFYSFADEQRVISFCKAPDRKGFAALLSLQQRLFWQNQSARKKKNQKKILQRMKSVGPLPRDIKGFMRRETLPQYIFYDYCGRKTEVSGYCTACRHEIMVKGAKHNTAGFCPRCGKAITFKSRGKRGRIIDRSTAQIIERIGEDELVVRFVKCYCVYPKSDSPQFSVYENARLFLRWKDNKIVSHEPYYWCYDLSRLTHWHKGERPVINHWSYNFEADTCGYLYHRNLDTVFEGTPWQYCALKEYYCGKPMQLYAARYLSKYLYYPMLEYLVKLRLYRLATYVVYGDEGGRQYYGNSVLNSDGKNVEEVLGVHKKHLAFLQEVDPGSDQLLIIRAMLRKNLRLDMELMRWCSQYGIGDEASLTAPLRFMTPHKLMRYATEQYAMHKRTSYFSSGYYNMSYVLSDYKDYLCMSEALDYDMKNDFVLFPKNLKEAHNRVNDMSDVEMSAADDRKIAKAFAPLGKGNCSGGA